MVLWIGFCHTVPRFMYVYLCVFCVFLRTLSSFSALTLLLGSLAP